VLVPFLFNNKQNKKAKIMRNHSKLISNCVLLKAAKKMDVSTWAFNGCLTIPFCTSRKVHLSEFRRLANGLVSALGESDKEIYWVANIVDGDESINNNGDHLVGHTKTFFLLSDVIDVDGKPLPQHRHDIYHLIHAIWRYEVSDLSRYNQGDLDFEECLGISGNTEGTGLDNQIEMSGDLIKFLFREKLKYEGKDL
jgi:hypothetical protein